MDRPPEFPWSATHPRSPAASEACTGSALRSTSSWDRAARRPNLCRNKLCSLGSGSGLPPSSSGLSAVSPTTQWSHLWILLWCPPHLPAAPGDHLAPPPLLLGRHPGLRHLLLHHGLLLHPLQPPRIPHPVCPLRGLGHLSPASSPAHRAGRPPPLLRHLLPPPPLRPLPPPALPPQAARARPTPGRFRKLGSALHWGKHSLGSTPKPQPPPLSSYLNGSNRKSIVYVLYEIYMQPL